VDKITNDRAHSILTSRLILQKKTWRGVNELLSDFGDAYYIVRRAVTVQHTH